MKYKRIRFQGSIPYNTLQLTQVLKVSTNSRNKRNEKERVSQKRSRLAIISKAISFETLTCNWSISEFKLQLSISNQKNMIFKRRKLNFKVSLDPCIDKAMEVCVTRHWFFIIIIIFCWGWGGGGGGEFVLLPKAVILWHSYQSSSLK